MWGVFILSVVFLAACVYVPGYLFVRSLGLCRAFSVACAPVISVFLYCSLAIAYGFVGISCSTASLCAPVFISSIAAFSARCLMKRGDSTSSRSKRMDSSLLFCGRVSAMLIYLVVSVIVCALIFFAFIGDPEYFAPTYDNVFHYNTIKSFSDSGVWSCLQVTAYPVGVTPESASPFLGSGYYPAAWHLLCAIAVTTCSAPVAVAANAVNYVMAALFYPAGMCFLMTCIFPKKPEIVLSGSLFTSAFCSFPWVLLFKWPLFPNALSLSMVPILAGCFILLCAERQRFGYRLAAGFIFLIGVICSVFTQPNAAFTAAAFLSPYCVWRVASEAGSRCSVPHKRIMRSFAFGTIAFLLIALVWLICFRLPFLQALVNYYWEPLMSSIEAVFNVLTLSFTGSGVQWSLAALVFIGFLYSIKHREYLWTLCSYALACLIFVCAASLGDVFVKHLLAGFWYTDPYRVGAFASVFAVPLASMGLYSVWAFASRLLRPAGLRFESAFKIVASIAIGACFIATNYSYYRLPGVSDSGMQSFGYLSQDAHAIYEPHRSWVYDSEESDFVERVKGAIPDGALVINQPYDGSLLSYCFDDLNVYYRSLASYKNDADTPDSRTIRLGLNEITSDDEVRRAVEESGAQYVLILDRDQDELESTYGLYRPEDWLGIDSIDGETPGFEEVLSDSGMVLYKIVA